MASPLGATESPAATKIQDIPLIKPSKEIPTSFRASFASWWASGTKEAKLSEERIFSRMPFFVPSIPEAAAASTSTPSSSTAEPNPHGVTASLSSVILDTPKRFLNTLSITPTSESSKPPKYPPTVILPGYGAGIGFFFLNLPSLAQWAARRNSPVYAVDWLGMGRSARVPFVIKAKRDDIPSRVNEAENFFLDALEEWRVKQGFEQMALIGHSLGGYLSTAYALKYPERVSRLILLSPAGVPRDPNSMNPAAEMDPSTSANSASSSTSSIVRPTAAEIKEQKEALKVARKNESMFRKFATWAWEEGWSPFAIVRSTVFWGPLIVGKYSSRRFSSLKDEDVRDMHDYIWHITSAKGSGEYCISHLLAPGAHARMPLVDRVHKLKIPTTFVYGDHDWMSVDGGRDAVENMNRAGNPDGRLYVIKNAGHHLYLDNPDATNDLMLRELKRPSTINVTSNTQPTSSSPSPSPSSP